MPTTRDDAHRFPWPRAGGLYVLVTRSLAALPFDQIIEACLRGGATAIQLREKEIQESRFVELARRAKQITDRLGGTLIVNDRPEVALAAGAHGVHLGQEDRDLAEVRRELGPGFLLGSSCHGVEDAERALAGGADYIGIGPIFETETKTIDYPRGIELVREIRRRVALPCFPLGGIDLDNVDRVLAAGPDGVAVCSAILRSPKMEDTVRAFVGKIHAARDPLPRRSPGKVRDDDPVQ